MKLYRCDWPNGETTYVLAKDKDDAVFRLDEFEGATPRMLHELDEFMLGLCYMTKRVERQDNDAPVEDEIEEDEASEIVVTDVGEGTWEEAHEHMEKVVLLERPPDLEKESCAGCLAAARPKPFGALFILGAWLAGGMDPQALLRRCCFRHRRMAEDAAKVAREYASKGVP